MTTAPSNTPAAKRQAANEAVAAAEASMSPEQIRIRELEDQLAKAMAKQDDERIERELKEEAHVGIVVNNGQTPIDRGALKKPGNILIHFVEDGFSALGKIWVRGQEIEFDPDDSGFNDTKDRFGKSWVHMSEGDQMDKYGKVYFRPGPWMGKSLVEGQFEALRALAEDQGFDLPTQTEILRAELEGRQRDRTPPRL